MAKHYKFSEETPTNYRREKKPTLAKNLLAISRPDPGVSVRRPAYQKWEILETVWASSCGHELCFKDVASKKEAKKHNYVFLGGGFFPGETPLIPSSISCCSPRKPR